MVFSSPTFLFFFLPSVLIFYLLASYFGTLTKNIVLLIASIFFYTWGEKEYVLVILSSIAINHTAGVLIGLEHSKGRRGTKILSLSIIINLLILGWFKYASFALENINYLLNKIDVTPLRLMSVHLPLGISFFTFQALSYVIDVYRKKAPAQRNPLQTALYISLFPQLIAGPIVRYNSIALQLTQRKVTLSSFDLGVKRFMLGLGKKVLLANSLAEFADYAFLLPDQNITTFVAWLGIFSYALQIYYDFSGYSDMAIGLGLLFGFNFPENFLYPYKADSVRDFWRRWHISLSTWFRDYLYIPLGGSRGTKLLTSRNLLIVFFLCGLWHGASWNFIVWGLFHGFFLALERGRWGNIISAAPRIVRSFYLLVVVLIGWVFFRAETLSHASIYIARLFGLDSGTYLDGFFILRFTSEFIFIFIVSLIFAFPILGMLKNMFTNLVVNLFGKKIGWFFYQVSTALFIIGLFLLCSAKMASGTYNPFIYFRF